MSKRLIVALVSFPSLALLFPACEANTPNTVTCTAASPATPPAAANGPSGAFGDAVTNGKINHIIVYYLENRSFDNTYGTFPGANGLSNATSGQSTQVDQTGATYQTLPQPLTTTGATMPPGLPNRPFPIENYDSISTITSDLIHRWYQEPLQINKGKMNSYVAYSDAKGLSMGYYNTQDLQVYQYLCNATTTAACNPSPTVPFTLDDNFFHGAFGGSYLNHQFLVASQANIFPNAPAGVLAILDNNGKLTQDGFVLQNGCYDVNTSYAVGGPYPTGVASNQLVPQQTYPTIGDRLTAKNVTWAWYSGGWANAIAGMPDSLFQYHHQPFAYFKNYAVNLTYSSTGAVTASNPTADSMTHLKDYTAFQSEITTGQGVEQVVFIKPIGELNEHSGYASVKASEAATVQFIQSVVASPIWNTTAIIITYDENGGYWDHVPPPTRDMWGPGTRVPAIIISPYANQTVDHTSYDTMSILATIEHAYGLDPMTTIDGNAADLAGSFDFTKTVP